MPIISIDFWTDFRTLITSCLDFSRVALAVLVFASAEGTNAQEDASYQAEAVALESDALRHGALTYALMREGLEAAEADALPKNGSIGMGELLSFGLSRVPELYEGLRTGSFEPLARGAVSLLTEATEVIPTVQQPALFDFRRKDREDVVIGTVELAEEGTDQRAVAQIANSCLYARKIPLPFAAFIAL